MNLISAQVKNYKCINDSTAFSVKGLTCLAGKNEAGKTAILQALRRLKPVEESERHFNELMEYPRARRHQLNDPGKDEVLVTTWDLIDDDLAALAEVLGDQAVKNSSVTITRRYKSPDPIWKIEFNERRIIDHLLTTTPRLTEPAKKRLQPHQDIDSLHNDLSRTSKPTIGETNLLRRIEDLFPDGEKNIATKILESRLPRFLYFPTYGTLPGRVSVEDVETRTHDETNQNESERLFFALLGLANVSIDELINAGLSEELIAKLESVSNRLSQEIFQYWSQNRDLRVQFRYDEARPDDPLPFDRGHVFSLRVENMRHGVSVRFDERSAGFVWFFSFLVWFSQMEQLYGDKLIILLDEPGLSLHGKAQADLLRYIKEKLLSKYQVIYTTHSPFMVDTSNILSVRTVEDTIDSSGATLGTKVGDRVLSSDSDTLFPLRAALGYDLTQSLFVGDYCLLVEGSSDLLFLQWASRQLTRQGRSRLDSRWTITPVGGITKLGSFAALFGGNLLQVAILADFHIGDKKKIRDLRESGLLQDSHIFLATQYTDRDEADVEDIIGIELYSELIDRCYGLTGEKRLSEFLPNGDPPRVVEVAERHLSVCVTEGPTFDHLSPAIFLLEHENDFRGVNGYEEALKRFEEFFAAINQLLPQSIG